MSTPDDALRERLEHTYRQRTPRSRALYQRALESLPGGDTRTGTFFLPYPTFMERGEGCRLVDRPRKDVRRPRFVVVLQKSSQLVLIIESGAKMIAHRTGVMFAQPVVEAFVVGVVKALLLQRWYGLSDPAMEEALKDRLSFRRFVGLPLSEAIPDHATLWRFREALDGGLCERLFLEIGRQIEVCGFVLKQGTLIDASRST